MGLYVYDCVSVDWGSGGRGSVWVAFNRLNNILSAGRRVYIWRASGRVGGGGGRGGREAHTGEEATYMKFWRFFNLANKAIFF